MGAIPGGKVVIGAYDESPYKTANPNGLRLPYTQFNLSPQQERERSQILTGYYGESRGVLGRQGLSGSVDSEAGPESIGFWLKHLIGTPTSAASGGAFKHTFQVGDDLKDIPPGFMLEEDFGTVLASATHRVLRHTGCRINTGAFNFGTSGFIGLSFDVLGAQVTPAPAPLDATLTDLGHTSWSATNVAIVLSDAAAAPILVCLNTLTLTHSNDLDADEYCITGGGVRDGAARGKVGATGQAVALFDTDALLKQALADTDASLVVTVQRGNGSGTAGNEKLVLTYPNIAFSPSGIAVSGPRGLRQTVNFTAHRTVGEIALKAELYNAQATV